MTSLIPLTATDEADADRAAGFCPTCLRNGVPTRMVQVSARAWICPIQRDEERRVSAAMLARVLDTASERVAGLPF